MWGKRQAELLGAKCRRCPLRAAPVVLPPPVSQKAVLAIVGEGPGPKEVVYGSFFAGPSGEVIDDIFEDAGFNRSLCHVTNATLCYPKGFSDEAKAEAVSYCKPRLEKELRRFRGKAILAYGQLALESLTGKKPLQHWCGSPLPGVGPFKRFKVIGTYHPAFIIRPDGGDFAPVTWAHTHRAVKLAKGHLPRWRWGRRIINPGIEAVRALEEMLETKEEVGFDFENIPDSNIIMATGIATRKVAVSMPWHAYGNRHGDHPRIEDCRHGLKIKRLMTDILEAQDIPKVAHNAAHDILCAERDGIEVGGFIYDTLPVSSLVVPNVPHTLAFMMALETHADRWKDEFHRTAKEKGVKAFIGKWPPDLRDYNGKDCFGALILKDHLEYHIAYMPNGAALRDEYFSLMPIALDMQRDGFRRDRERMKYHMKRLMVRKRAAEEEIKEGAALVGMDVDPNSHKQMHRLFFGRLGVLPKYFSEKTGGPSLPEKALVELVTHDNELVRLLSRATLRQRKVAALIKFVDPKNLPKDNVTHVEQKPYAARTFRWSSSPNLMNIPKPLIARRKRGGGTYVKEAGLRDTFIPHRKGDWIVCADYDQIELKIIACLAEDLPLVELFNAGADPHRAAAADLFGCTPEEVTKNERDMAKIAQYEIWYGGGVETLWKHIVVDFPTYTLKKARQQHDNYCSRHPVEEYHEKALARAEEDKKITAPLSGHEMVFYARRVEPAKVYNWPVQHTASDIINPAIRRVKKALRKGETLLTPVHDEIVTCGPDPVRLGEVLTKCMTRTITINGHRMLFSVGVKLGPSWGEVEEVKATESLRSGVQRIAGMYKGRLRP